MTKTPRYTAFQRRVMQAVADWHDPYTPAVARHVRSTRASTQRSLNLLVDRGDVAPGRYLDGPWHLTAKGQRRLLDWGTGK